MSTRCSRFHTAPARPWSNNYLRTLISPLHQQVPRAWLGTYTLADEYNRKWYTATDEFWREHCRRSHKDGWQCSQTSEPLGVLFGTQYYQPWLDDKFDHNGAVVNDYLRVQTESEYLAEECHWLKGSVRTKAASLLQQSIDTATPVWKETDNEDRR